jgi:predicted lysophospholipase L1 biosynthesis ABC-type transport system permease subunit
MPNPAAQPRRLFLASLVMLALLAIVVLLGTGHLFVAVAVGAVAAAALVTAARPTGEGRGGR